MRWVVPSMVQRRRKVVERMIGSCQQITVLLLFLPVPYDIGVSMEQQRSPGLDQFENLFHIIHKIQCLLPWFLNAPSPLLVLKSSAYSLSAS